MRVCAGEAMGETRSAANLPHPATSGNSTSLLFVSMSKCWLWRAVDHDGYVLDEIAQTRLNTEAAKRLLTRLMKKQGMTPNRLLTDKLRSYGAAKRQVMPAVDVARTKA